jgi:hypothetical protein
MLYYRRTFLQLMAGGVTARIVHATPLVQATITYKIKAIAFDGFPIFDPRPIFALTEELFPGKGTDLSTAWRTRVRPCSATGCIRVSLFANESAHNLRAIDPSYSTLHL